MTWLALPSFLLDDESMEDAEDGPPRDAVTGEGVAGKKGRDPVLLLLPCCPPQEGAALSRD